MSFGAIHNNYENRQHNYTAQKKTNGTAIFKQQQMMLSEKVKNRETEESFQIGAKTFTNQEWKEFLDKYDSIQEVIKELMRERHKLQEKEKLGVEI